MADMLERAAKAMWETFPERVHQPWDNRREEMKDETRREARAALLAALDPEALSAGDVHFVCMSVRAAAPSAGAYGNGLTADEVRLVCGALAKLAQGER